MTLGEGFDGYADDEGAVDEKDGKGAVTWS